MGKERFQEIKGNYEHFSRLYNGKLLNVPIEDFDWLISEVERLQEDNRILKNAYSNLDFKRDKSEYEWGNEYTQSQQKVERLENVIKQIENGYRGSGEVLDEILDTLFFGGKNGLQALETEGKE